MTRSTRLLLGLVLLAMAAIPLVSRHQRDLIQIFGELTCVAVCWRHLLPQRDLHAKGWALVVGGATLTAIADTLAALEVDLWHLTTFPRPSTLIVLVGYACLGTGAVLFDRRRVKGTTQRGVIEAAIFGLGGLGPVLVFLVLPQMNLDAPLGSRITVAAYALADLMILTVLARLLLTDSTRSRSLLYLGAALLVSLAGDLVSSLTALSFQGSHTNNSVAAMLWLVGYVLLAAGISHPSLRGLTYGTFVDADKVTPRSPAALLAIGLLLPPCALAVGLVLGQTRYLWAPAIVGMLVSALVALRFTRLIDYIGQQSDQLNQLARSDELTGLPNRRSWNHAVIRACQVAESSSRPLCFALFDLDRFKDYNDSHGHPAGDVLLRRVAGSWSGALHEGEFLARYGGEEFAMLLPGLTLEEAATRAEELRVLVPAPQSASVGVASWSPGTDPALTLAEADLALYQAKRAGRARTVVADTSLEPVPGPLRDLLVVVQPIVRLADGAVVGHECLSRFPHTTDIESVFADAHDKQYGDLLEISALRAVLEREDRPADLELFVNVSERAMRSERFWTELPEDLHGVLIELSEHRDGLEDEEVSALLERFRARGARVGLDDVGSSATDFARVGSLRPDIAKIDRSLVANVDKHPARVEVLRMLIEFAQARGVEVCVEGVETAAELETVRSAGATYAQGYLLGRPGPDWAAPAPSTPTRRALV